MKNLYLDECFELTKRENTINNSTQNISSLINNNITTNSPNKKRSNESKKMNDLLEKNLSFDLPTILKPKKNSLAKEEVNSNVFEHLVKYNHIQNLEILSLIGTSLSLSKSWLSQLEKRCPVLRLVFFTPSSNQKTLGWDDIILMQTMRHPILLPCVIYFILFIILFILFQFIFISFNLFSIYLLFFIFIYYFLFIQIYFFPIFF